MGTRGTTTVIIDGKVRVLQYGQWDHYPEGQGLDALKFARRLKDPEILQEFKDKVRALRTVEVLEEEPDVAAWNNLPYDSRADGYKEIFPEFHRDTGTQILSMILDDKVHRVHLDEDGVKWGEGFPTINLDEEIYRFAYYEHDHAFPLSNLPTNAEFLKMYEQDEEDN